MLKKREARDPRYYLRDLRLRQDIVNRLTTWSSLARPTKTLFFTAGAGNLVSESMIENALDDLEIEGTTGRSRIGRELKLAGLISDLMTPEAAERESYNDGWDEWSIARRSVLAFGDVPDRLDGPDETWENPILPIHETFGPKGVRRLDSKLLDMMEPHRGRKQIQAVAVVADRLLQEGVPVVQDEALKRIQELAMAKNPRKKARKKSVKKKANPESIKPRKRKGYTIRVEGAAGEYGYDAVHPEHAALSMFGYSSPSKAFGAATRAIDKTVGLRLTRALLDNPKKKAKKKNPTMGERATWRKLERQIAQVSLDSGKVVGVEITDRVLYGPPLKRGHQRIVVDVKVSKYEYDAAKETIEAHIEEVLGVRPEYVMSDGHLMHWSVPMYWTVTKDAPEGTYVVTSRNPRKKAKKKTIKKKAKRLVKKAKKVAKTKSGRIGIGAGAGALLLGPIGAVGGALYGASTGKRKKKNPGYELNPRGKKKRFTWTKKKITPGGLSSDGVAYLTPRIVRGETLKWVILKNRKRWHTYLIDGYTGDILGKQGAGSTTLAAAKAKAVDIKVTKMPKGTKYKKEKRGRNPEPPPHHRGSARTSVRVPERAPLKIGGKTVKQRVADVKRELKAAGFDLHDTWILPYDEYEESGRGPRAASSPIYIISEGEIGTMMGTGEGPIDEFEEALRRAGFWYELDSHWLISLIPLDHDEAEAWFAFLEARARKSNPKAKPRAKKRGRKNPEPTMRFSKTWAKMLLLCCGSDPGDESKFTPIDLFGYKVLQGEEVPLSLVIDTKAELERLEGLQTDAAIREEIEGFVEGLEFLISKQVNPARAFSLETEVKRSRQKKAKKAALSSVAAEKGARSARAESVRRTLASLNPGEGTLSSYQGKLERLGDTALAAEHRKLSRLLKGSKDPVRDFGTEGLPMLERMIELAEAEKKRRKASNPAISRHARGKPAALKVYTRTTLPKQVFDSPTKSQPLEYRVGRKKITYVLFGQRDKGGAWDMIDAYVDGLYVGGITVFQDSSEPFFANYGGDLELLRGGRYFSNLQDAALGLHDVEVRPPRASDRSAEDPFVEVHGLPTELNRWQKRHGRKMNGKKGHPLLVKCREAWEKYCASPTKRGIQACHKRFEKGIKHADLEVRKECRRGMRACRLEMREWGLKPNPSYQDALLMDVTKKEAIREIGKHMDAFPEMTKAEVIKAFFADVGEKDEYEGEEVLAWLGY